MSNHLAWPDRLRVLLSVLLLTGQMVVAAPSYLEEYQAYQAAFARGDVANALSHGHAAWQAAESELGDHDTTAVLAFNYARLAFTHPDSAITAERAYARAMALTEAGKAEFDLSELAIALAEVQLYLRPDDRQQQRQLAAVLRARLQAKAPPSDVSAHAWRSLARVQMDRGAMGQAMESADQAADEAAKLTVPDTLLQRDALVLAGMARLALHRGGRGRDRLQEAADLLERAIALYPPQTDIDSFDRSLATALLLRESISSLKRSGRRGKYEEAPGAQGLIPVDHSRYAHCPDPTIHRVPVSFPREALQDGVVAAVLVGIDFGETAVDRVVVLAEPSKGGFGEAAIKAIERWTIEPGVPEECRTNLFQIVSFSIRPS